MLGLGSTVAAPLSVKTGVYLILGLLQAAELPAAVPGNLAFRCPAPGGRVLAGQGAGEVR